MKLRKKPIYLPKILEGQLSQIDFPIQEWDIHSALYSWAFNLHPAPGGGGGGVVILHIRNTGLCRWTGFPLLTSP